MARLDSGGAFRRWRAALFTTAIAAAALWPAGETDASEATRALRGSLALEARVRLVVEQARVETLAERYRHPPQRVRAIVRAAERAATRHDLPASLLLAIIETESSLDPRSRSSYGARGLMQVVPRHHPKEVAAIGGPERLHDIEPGIEVGARVLAGYLARSGDLRQALRRYSGGARRYADKVLARQQAIDRVTVLATRTLDQPTDLRVATSSATDERS